MSHTGTLLLDHESASQGYKVLFPNLTNFFLQKICILMEFSAFQVHFRKGEKLLAFFLLEFGILLKNIFVKEKFT